MCIGLVGLMLSYGMLLAQSNTESSGQLTVSSVDITSGSSVSSDHPPADCRGDREAHLHCQSARLGDCGARTISSESSNSPAARSA